MYKTILFDFDGTLVDTGEGIKKSVQYAARSLGFVEDDLEALRCFIGPPMREQWAKRYGVDAETIEKLMVKYRERYAAEGLYECEPYPGIEELLKALRGAGKVLLVATGKPTVYTDAILKNLGLDVYFDAVLGSELDGRRSQKSEVIAELLENRGYDGAVMVGDRDNDVRGATACGLPCIGVGWGYAEPGELMGEGAVMVIENTEELKNVLLG